MKEMVKKTKREDCILKMEGGKINSHKLILEARSPVLAAMFKDGPKETNEITIADMETSTMKHILQYIYTADMNALETDKAFSVYAAAAKYDMKNVKQLCTEFLLNELCISTVCRVIEFGDLYEDEKICSRAKEYFKENIRQILKTEEWKKYAKENPHKSVELLGSVITAVIPE